MGIPSYFSYIVRNHPQIIRKLCDIKLQINNLYLDCNSIIYDAILKIDFKTLAQGKETDTIISMVCKKIEEYIAQLRPNKCVYIAFDGVAPVAKLDQQRDRRFKSIYQSNVTRSILKTSGPDPWNTAAITPGTIFMKRLNDECRHYFADPAKFSVGNIVVSGSDCHGEGEHKIFEHIRANPVQHRDEITIIYGLDADLIMLSINHLPITNKLYLFRETPEFIKSISQELEPNESYIMDIPELAMTITQNMNNDIEMTDEQRKNCIYDYIFLCFFLGNDFMPHFPAVNIRTGGVDKMIQAYKATIGGTNENLTDGKTIFWKNVRKMVKFLADNEEEFIKTEYKSRDRREKQLMPDITPQNKVDKFMSMPCYERSIEKYINPFKPDWQTRYYKSLFKVDIDETRQKQICTNYLEGLEWTMKYYTVGCADWRWSYNYNYPPLLCDLLEYIPYFPTEFIKDSKPNPVNPLVQLCYVLPKQSLQLLPQNLYGALIKEKLDWYKADCEYDWSFCRYFWEAHTNLPYLDINELEAFVRKHV